MTLTSVSRQGILLLFEDVYIYFESTTHQKINVYIILLFFEAAYKYFDPPTHQKIHLYMYIF